MLQFAVTGRETALYLLPQNQPLFIHTQHRMPLLKEWGYVEEREERERSLIPSAIQQEEVQNTEFILP
jgi:hypothetical protein